MNAPRRATPAAGAARVLERGHIYFAYRPTVDAQGATASRTCNACT
jgi:hypothetical protein